MDRPGLLKSLHDSKKIFSYTSPEKNLYTYPKNKSSNEKNIFYWSGKKIILNRKKYLKPQFKAKKAMRPQPLESVIYCKELFHILNDFFLYSTKVVFHA